MLRVVTNQPLALDTIVRSTSTRGTDAGDRVTLGSDAVPSAQRPTPAAATEGPAPLGPGNHATWTTAAKEGIGTSNTPESKVAFTLTNGCLTEVYYPTVDKANVREMKFVVSDGKTFSVFDTDTPTKVAVVGGDSLTYQYVAEDKQHGFKLTKTYITDPKRNTVMVNVDLESTSGKPLDLYVVYDPALNNSGMHDSSRTQDGVLLSHDGGVGSALVSSVGFQEVNNGFAGTSDGVADLLRNHQLPHHYDSATEGNVVQVGKLLSGSKGANLTLALGFGDDEAEARTAAEGSLADGFQARAKEYAQGWQDWLGHINFEQIDPTFRPLIKVAAMALKAHEDKSNPGAFVASMTIPWGDFQNADEADLGGYHLVWPRDLYQVALAFLAIGDPSTARRCAGYMFHKQQLPDGSFPQNTWIDGSPYWRKLQMDQTAFPVVLAWQIDHNRAAGAAPFVDEAMYRDHIKPAAEFIAKHGPRTDQERWEEMAGLSPSTIAASIAGLVCAADIARQKNDPGAADFYEKTADEWKSHLDQWLVTHTDGDPHYLRVNDSEDPDDGHQVYTPNGGGQIRKDHMVDGGFLELVRLGIKRPDDPNIKQSLAVVDRTLRIESPQGPLFYRYNPEVDNYGETETGQGFTGVGKGRPWPLLSGERGIYEQMAGGDPLTYMRALAGSANDGGMIPEQVFDHVNPAGTKDDPHLTLGQVAQTLRDNYNVARAAAGDRDQGFITRAELEALQKRDDQPVLQQAAGFLLADQKAFDTLDTAAFGGTPDGKIGFEDLDKTVQKRPLDFLPHTLQLGAGTGSATPLAWALAVAIRLAVSMGMQNMVETPQVVADRYANQEKPAA